LKAFILAAGHGTRLRPLTDTVPKCLVPIRGTPMLQIWLETCRRFGIDEVLINIHAHANLVRQFLRTQPDTPRVHVVEEEELMGSAGTLVANRSWVQSEDFFWVFYVDVLNRANLSAMLRLHQTRNSAATLGVYTVPDPSRCGIVELEPDGIVRQFVEKPPNPKSNLAFSGLLIGTQRMLECIPHKQPVDIGFDVLPLLVGDMLAYPISDYLIDIGTVENYRKAQATWEDI
jgi:mannose-1-phosphate guanylyltransferase